MRLYCGVLSQQFMRQVLAGRPVVLVVVFDWSVGVLTAVVT